MDFEPLPNLLLLLRMVLALLPLPVLLPLPLLLPPLWALLLGGLDSLSRSTKQLSSTEGITRLAALHITCHSGSKWELQLLMDLMSPRACWATRGPSRTCSVRKKR
jgi:hypothetical protein